MASPSPFQNEDQTDEAFFDKLVDDDLSVGRSHPDSKEKELSNLSLGHVATSLDDSGDAGFISESKDWEQSYSLQSFESLSNGILVSEESASSDFSVTQAAESRNSAANTMEVGSPASSTLGDGGLKVSGIKEVQWSAFSINFQQVDKGGNEPDLDFFAETPNVSAEELRNAEANPSFIGNQDESLSKNVSTSGIQDPDYPASTNELNPGWNDAQYWENLYPGWKYDASTGQWYQVNGYEISTGSQLGTFSTDRIDAKESFENKAQDAGILQGSSDALYMQQTAKSVLETIEEDSTVTNFSNWNLDSHETTRYPSNMVFDPQYPGWYYDTNTQQVYTLESYTATTQESSVVHEQVSQDVTAFAGFSGEGHNLSDGIVVSEENSIQGERNVGSNGVLNASTSSYTPQNMWQPDPVDKSGQVEGISGYQQTGSFSGSAGHAGSNTNQQIHLQTIEPTANLKYRGTSSFIGSHNLNHGESMYQFNQQKVEHSQHSNSSNSYYGNQNTLSYSQQQFHGVSNPYSQFSHASHEGRSLDGRPVHALVSFGFGGKIVVMKDPTSFGRNLNLGNQGNPGAEIFILNLSEAVKDKYDDSSVSNGPISAYFNSLCKQSFPGPLVGGNAATKDVNKWIDERIKNYESAAVDFQKGKLLNLLLSLLKISCQHYGKLRSPFGSDPSLEETDGPEMAVTKLFASAKKNLASYGENGSLSHFMQNFPSEGKIQATAIEVQNLLVSGRRKEALQCAQEGQLWGPALALAAQLGDKFYVDTVKKMAYDQFIPGSPLRTLCLLIAGQPADVFSACSLNGGITSPQPAEIRGSWILDDWEENLAIITSNRTKDDELVMIHLGDCLWRERGQVAAAHTCYMVAEVNFESHSDSARLCLLGADHWKYPRTYASPDAIQRTELYEYSKVLGNSQFILVPFQPYKLIYAFMLAEVGKVSDSMRYCQASLKLLKNSARAPEVEMWKSMLSSLEERLRTHQQGGYDTNLAPKKLVGKLITSIDRGIHRMMGAPSPSAPLPPMPQGNLNDKEPHYPAPKVANSQSTMIMSSLISSPSVETMNQLTSDSGRKIFHNRSISEPDFGRSPKQDAGSDGVQGKEGVSGGTRFGRIGSQLLQKTMGWVSRSNRQAKLGEQNKFCYDEKLKRWVEEGSDPPAEEPALPPPPKASLQNGMPDYVNNAPNNRTPSFIQGSDARPSISSEHNSGIPPIPPSQNQFSARGRMGVRSRYVDTFNKGGGISTGSFQSPSLASAKSLPMAGTTFFVPATPATPDEHGTSTEGERNHVVTNQEEPSTSILAEPSFSSPPSSSSSSMQRFPSMDSIASTGYKGSGAWCGYEHTRAASLGGTDVFKTLISEVNSHSDGYKVSSFLPNNISHDHSSNRVSLPQSGGTLGDDLHEVEL